MIALGLWQLLDRLPKKEAFLAQLAANPARPPMAFPSLPDETLLFRRATGVCLEPTAIRLAGAGYLAVLAITTWRRAGAPLAEAATVPNVFRRGFVVNITNPKIALFFVAFLPQFVDQQAGRTGLQVALLGLAFGVMACCSDSLWALAAGRARAWFARTPSRLDALGAGGGLMMVGLGATMLASE